MFHDAPEFRQASGSGAVLLQEREHVVPVTIPHDEAEELQFSDFKGGAEPDTSFHVASDDGGEHPKPEVYAGQTVYFDAPPHPDGDMVAFDPDQRFDATQEFGAVELNPFGEGGVRHDDNPFGAELFGDHAPSESTHEQNGDVSFKDMSLENEGHHGDHGIEMLHESAAAGDDAAPWNPSNWGETSEHDSSAEHSHHEHDDIAVVEDDAMSAVDFAGIKGKLPATSDEPGATPAKKKKRRTSSGGGIGRMLGIVVSGAAALPAVGLLGAIMGQKTDVFGFRPYLQKVPYVSKYVGASAQIKTRRQPSQPLPASRPRRRPSARSM